MFYHSPYMLKISSRSYTHCYWWQLNNFLLLVSYQKMTWIPGECNFNHRTYKGAINCETLHPPEDVSEVQYF